MSRKLARAVSLMKVPRSRRQGPRPSGMRNRVPVRRTITRGGRTFQQIYWVSPDRAAKLEKKAVQQVGKFGEEAGSTLALERWQQARDRKLDLWTRDWKDWDPEDPSGRTLAKQQVEELEGLRKKAFTEDAGEVMDKLKQAAPKSGWPKLDHTEEVDDLLGVFYQKFRNQPGNGLERMRKILLEAEKLAKERGANEITVDDARKVLVQKGLKRPREWKQKSLTLPVPNPPNPYPERLDVDEVSLRELQIFIENDGGIYRQRREPLEEQAKQQWENGRFSEVAFKKAILDSDMLYDGALKYTREFGSRGESGSFYVAARETFPDLLREQLARDFARQFTEELESGEHGEGGHRPPRKSRKKHKRYKMGKAKVESGYADRLDSAVSEFNIDSDELMTAFAAPEGYEYTIDSVYGGGYDDDVTVSGSIRNDAGEYVGTMTRHLSKEYDGTLRVEHKEFKIDKEFQDTKIGSRMILNQFENYESWGVGVVDVETAWVGKYFWLKVGFVPDASSERAIRSSAVRFIERSELEDEQKAMVLQKLDGDLIEFARAKNLPMVKYNAPQYEGVKTAPINKALLLDSGAPGWNGSLDVGSDTWDGAMELLNGYFEED